MVENHEFPRLVLHSVPVPAQTRSSEGLPAVTEQLKREIAQLGASGAEVFVLACITMHSALPEFRDARPSGTWISAIDETVATLQRAGHRHVAVLSTEVSEREGLFTAPLRAHGIEVVALDDGERRDLSGLIDLLIGGRLSDERVAGFIALCRALRSRGATAIVLGCTDLSCLPPVDVPGAIIYDALALAAVAAWRAACS